MYIIVLSSTTLASPIPSAGWKCCLYDILMTGQVCVPQCIPTKFRKISAVAHFLTSSIWTLRVAMNMVDPWLVHIIRHGAVALSEYIRPILWAPHSSTASRSDLIVCHCTFSTPQLISSTVPSIKHCKRLHPANSTHLVSSYYAFTHCSFLHYLLHCDRTLRYRPLFCLR